MDRARFLAVLTGVLALLVIWMCTAQAAYTVAYNGSEDSETLYDACEWVRGQSNAHSGWHVVGPCKVWKHGATNTWTIGFERTGGGWNGNATASPSGSPSGNTCLNALWSGASSTPGAYGAGDLACEVCPEGTEWDDDPGQCVAPDPEDCDEGEVFDENLDACRADCESPSFFHYSTNSCQAQCPVGKSPTHYVLSNKPEIGFTGLSTVNGCKVEQHFYCMADVGDPPHYTGEYFTGKVCASWWEYNTELNVEFISQAEYELETGSSGYYEGDTGEPNIVGAATPDGVTINVEELATAPDEAVEIVAAHTLCAGGVQRIVITVDGTPDEVIFLGACPSQNQDFTNPGPSTNEYNARLESKVDDIKTEQTEQTTVLDAIKDLAEDIKAQTTEMMTAMSGGEGGGGGLGGLFDANQDLTEEEEAELDLPDGPEPYERRFPGGVSEAMDSIDEPGAFAHYFDGLELSFGSGDVPECLSFEFTLPFVGTVPFTPYCEMWDIIAACLMSLGIFAAWRIVFG